MSATFDTILEKGTIYDGTGAKGYVADVAIKDGKIAEIGDLSASEDANRINVEGLAVTPGFIDLHTHSDFTLVVNGKAESQVHQGVTTEVIGQCGHSVAPLCCGGHPGGRSIGHGDGDVPDWTSFADYLDVLDSRPLGVNVAAFVVGHQVLGNLDSRCGVPTIGISADGLAELLVQRCPADQHDVVVANAVLLHRVDHDFHVRHRRCQQRGHAQDIGAGNDPRFF